MSSFVPPSATTTVADLNPLLLDAKNIYVNQLSEAVGPYILKTMEALYAETTEAGSSKVWLRFQAKMKQIPLWNSTLVETHAAAIEAKYPYLADLIAAAFVAYVKVMSSIKLRDDKPNIRLKLPTNPAFVHKAFVNVARDFYNAPQLGHTTNAYQGMRSAIEKTIRDMLPIQDILKAYLGNTVDNAHTVSPMLDDGEDACVEDDDDVPESPASPAMFDDAASPPQPQPLPQPLPQPAVPVVPAPTLAEAHAPATLAALPAPHAPAAGPTAVVTECETKTISIPPAKDDDLFSDADDNETDWKRA